MSEPEQNEQPTVETLDADHPAVEEEAAVAGKVEEPAPPTTEEQLAAEKDRVLRLKAELQNTLSRKSREMADERRYAGLAVIRDLLPVLDNVDRAIEAAEKAGETGTLLEGFQLVRQQLATVLTQHQVESIDPLGEPFNPDFHEAILQQPSPDHEAGVVMMTTQLGYKLHDRVVRPCQVIVSSGAPDA